MIQLPKASRREWAEFIVAALLAVAAYNYRGSGVVRAPGSTQKEQFTFVPSDRDQLACLPAGDSLGDCKSSDPGRRIVPAVTTDRRLVLLRGVLRFFPPTGKSDERFVMNCTVVLEEQLKSASIRFGKKDQFKSNQNLWLERATSCKVLAPGKK